MINSEFIKFGRKVPKDWEHVTKYPLRKLSYPVPKSIEVQIDYPLFVREFYDQGITNGCVGYSSSIMMTIYNEYYHYDAPWLWQRAKVYDNDPVTKEGDNEGTYVSAAFDVLRKEGHKPFGNDKPEPEHGILSNYWAMTVDEMRIALSLNRPVVIGINWYSEFMYPVFDGGKWWIGNSPNLGYVQGGHAICVIGASDALQAFKLINSWGRIYPIVWIPYKVMSRLLEEDGESVVAIDLQ